MNIGLLHKLIAIDKNTIYRFKCSKLRKLNANFDNKKKTISTNISFDNLHFLYITVPSKAVDRITSAQL